MRVKFSDAPVGTIVITAYLCAGLILTAYPLFYIISLGVMPYDQYMSAAIHFIPNGFTLIYFKQILADASLPHGFTMSMYRVLLGTVLSVTCTTLAAYALSLHRLKAKRFLSVFFMIPMFFSPGVIPFYLTINAYGITNTVWALVLPYLCIPMWFFVAKANFSGYPPEILEAADIDGAGQFRIFWQIVWPTNVPLIATLGMMYGVYHWNEYFYTRLLVGKNLWTAPVHLYALINEQRLLMSLGVGVKTQPLCYQAAVAACLIIPVLVVYPLLQRFIVSGLTAGAVKG
jgi:putative aldouronate transport system permease protein